ncbi:MAG: LemA family protein, partial [Patescibacteria group bacterium]|nr:LemA family protein [Patescibacteria group bacterium]
KRQAEMIPNLVASVKGYMQHEQAALTKITDARKSILEAVQSNDSQKLVDAAASMASALTPIKAIFESTPELKAAEPTQKLMDELRDTADKVMYSRRTLIDLTADYNTLVATVPSSMIANLFNFAEKPGLKTADSGASLTVSAKEMETPKVAL